MSVQTRSWSTPAWNAPVCAECGSTRLKDFCGYFETGVCGPNGEPEIYWRDGVRCLECGYVEEWQ